MGKTLGIIAAIVVVVVAVFIGMGFTGDSGDESTGNTASETESNLNSAFLENENVNTETGNANSVASGDENVNDETTIEESGVEKDVAVTNSGFSPATLTIKAGDSVTWTNERSQAVYVAPDEHPDHKKYSGVWDDDGSGQIAADESYTMTFTDAGSYTYHDHLNSSVTGTIIVTE